MNSVPLQSPNRETRVECSNRAGCRWRLREPGWGRDQRGGLGEGNGGDGGMTGVDMLIFGERNRLAPGLRGEVIVGNIAPFPGRSNV